MENPTGIPTQAPGILSNDEKVFGVGFKRDQFGNPIEQGVGAPGRETSQHKAALERMKRLANTKDGDREELKAILKDLIQPPEDMTPEQRAAKELKDAAAKAQEDAQEKRLNGLEEMVKQQADTINKLMAMQGSAANFKKQKPSESGSDAEKF